MKLTNGEIFKSKVPLQGLAKQKFPVKTSFALIKLAQKLSVAFEPIELCRQGLIQKYGTQPEHGPMRVLPVTEVRDDDGKVVSAEPNPDYPKFAAEYDELMEQEVEVEFERVVVPETFEIEPGALLALEKFIEI